MSKTKDDTNRRGIDQEAVEQILKQIEKKIDNEEFTVKYSLNAEAIGISQKQLNSCFELATSAMSYMMEGGIHGKSIEGIIDLDDEMSECEKHLSVLITAVQINDHFDRDLRVTEKFGLLIMWDPDHSAFSSEMKQKGVGHDEALQALQNLPDGDDSSEIDVEMSETPAYVHKALEINNEGDF